jgi:phage antirepressor YoqD-like protein/phage regulator Rha-like protein
MHMQTPSVQALIRPAPQNANHDFVARSELVTMLGDQAVTTSTAIAAGCEVDHASVIKLVRSYQADLAEFGLLDFKSESTGGRPTEFALLNEQQATLLLTYMRNTPVVREFKKRLVKEFWRLAHAKPAFDITSLSDPKLLLALLTDNVRKVVALEADNTELSLENHALEQKVCADAPKVEFFDAVTVTHETYSVAEAAKLIGTGQNRLMAFLRQRRWVTIRKNEPMQVVIERGYLTAKLSTYEHPENGQTTVATARVTGKGLTKLRAMWAGRDAALIGGEA